MVTSKKMGKTTTTSLREYTDEEIRNALNNSRNYTEFARLLNCQKRNSVYQKKNIFHYLNQIGIYDLTIEEMQKNYDEVHFGNCHCLNCGKLLEINQAKEGNKFCSSSCAATYNNTGSKHSEESKQRLKETQKTSEKVRKAIIKRYYNGDEELYNQIKNDINYKKDLKKQQRDNKRKRKYCKICGRELVNGKCLNDFCIKNIRTDFYKLSKYFGFDISKYGTLEVEKEFDRIRQLIYDIYWNQHLSSTQMTSKFNLPVNSIHNYFKLFNIPTKSIKYSTIENIKNNRFKLRTIGQNTRYEKHITWNNKIVFLRSLNEIKYAEYLDE